MTNNQVKKQGVVFDFNGTLFWDTHLQNRSWDRFLAKYNFSLTEEEKNRYIHGINSKDTFGYLFKRSLTEKEVYDLTEEKEVAYRAMCLENGMEFAPGALGLIGFLKSKGVKMAIATASGKGNVEFFIEHFNLLDYFERDHIVYNDGTMAGKPAPDLFDRAIRVLGVNKADVTVFEDSQAGMKAAENAGAGRVVIVDSGGLHFDTDGHLVISHFDEVPRDWFL